MLVLLYQYISNDILEFAKYQVTLDFLECNSQNEIQKCNLLSWCDIWDGYQMLQIFLQR